MGNISKESKRQIVMGWNLGIGIPPFFGFSLEREKEIWCEMFGWDGKRNGKWVYIVVGKER